MARKIPERCLPDQFPPRNLEPHERRKDSVNDGRSGPTFPTLFQFVNVELRLRSAGQHCQISLAGAWTICRMPPGSTCERHLSGNYQSVRCSRSESEGAVDAGRRDGGTVVGRGTVRRPGSVSPMGRGHGEQSTFHGPARQCILSAVDRASAKKVTHCAGDPMGAGCGGRGAAALQAAWMASETSRRCWLGGQSQQGVGIASRWRCIRWRKAGSLRASALMRGLVRTLAATCDHALCG